MCVNTNSLIWLVTYEISEVWIPKGSRIRYYRTSAEHFVVFKQRYFRYFFGQQMVNVGFLQCSELLHVRSHIAYPVAFDDTRRLRSVRDIVRVLIFHGLVIAALLHNYLPQTGDDFIFEIVQPVMIIYTLHYRH